jgi:hypothetical protein
MIRLKREGGWKKNKEENKLVIDDALLDVIEIQNPLLYQEKNKEM